MDDKLLRRRRRCSARCREDLRALRGFKDGGLEVLVAVVEEEEEEEEGEVVDDNFLRVGLNADAFCLQGFEAKWLCP